MQVPPGLKLVFLLTALLTGLEPAWTQQALVQRPQQGKKALKQFVPGEVWLDTAGKPINAHGGGMLCKGRTYFWYGENKEGRTWVPEANRKWDGYRVDVTGVRCYSSRDLYAWKDEGLVLKATPAEPASDLHPSKVVERPKVAFNPRTRKYVMWMHIDTADYQSARAGVAVSSSARGPFRYLGSVKPEGADSRDQSLFVDEDGKAYRVYSSEWNKATYISLLSDDWLQHSGKFMKVIAGQSLEAQAIFKRGGKYYLIASGCSGWDPNPAHAAVAESIWGPWRELGNPCLGGKANTTFGAQSTFVFPLAGKRDAYVFMADRWNKSNLPDSRYVWLPLQFRDDGLKLEWLDRWDLSFFDGQQQSSRGADMRSGAFSVGTGSGFAWYAPPSETAWFPLDICNRN
jgi:beta-xylosidase